MAELFKREASLQIQEYTLFPVVVGLGGLEITGLRFSFSVNKSLQPEPNECEVSVWNMAQETIAKLQRPQTKIILSAGYLGSTEQIFIGDVLVSSTVRQGPDFVTNIQAGDGRLAYRNTRINESFGPGIKPSAVIGKLAEKLQKSLGKSVKAILKGDVRGATTEFKKGLSLSGNAATELTKMCDSMGLEWSIQDGQLQILTAGEVVDNQAILINPYSGLVGSPEIGENKIVKCKSLLQGKIRPGKKIRVESEHINGFFRVLKCKHTGDTYGGEWYTEMEAQALAS